MADWDFLDEVDILAKLPSTFDEFIQSKKWQERKEALQGLLTLLEANPRLCPKASYGDVVRSLQQVIAKDTNVMVAAVAAKCLTGLAQGLRGKFTQFASSLFPIFFDKLKEKKATLRDPLVECMDAVATTIPSLESLQDDLLAFLVKPNPQIKQQVALFVYRQFNKIAGDKAPKKFLKSVVPVLGKMLGDPDATVRDAAAAALAAVHRMIGEKNAKTLLGDLVDEAKMKKVGEFLAKAQSDFDAYLATLATAAPATSNTAGDAAEEEEAEPTESGAAGGAVAAGPQVEEDPFDFLDPFDIVGNMPENFEANLGSKKWQERKEALEALLSLMTKHPKLETKASYGDLVALLKKLVEKDANINVAALAAKCLKGLADGLRKKFAPHAASVLPAILDKFKEKKAAMKDPLVECIDAVYKTVNLESMEADLLAAMEKPNPNIKIQTDLFIYRAFLSVNSTTMPKKTLKALMPLLVKHAGGSDPELRTASFAAIGGAMRIVGEKACAIMLGDLPTKEPAKMEKIREFCEKAKGEAVPEPVTAAPVVEQKAPPATTSKTNATAAAAAKKPAGPSKKPPSRPGSRGPPTGRNVKEDEGEKPPTAKPATTPAVREPEESNEPEEPKEPELLLMVNDGKAQRIKDEKTLKSLKWSFSSPTSEHISQLRQQVDCVAKATLSGLLFHKDFKQHMKACTMITEMAETCPDAIVKNSDLLLKWCTLRFVETNPAVLTKTLELSLTIVRAVQDADEKMSIEEISSFVPFLLLKSGESKESMRSLVSSVVHTLTDINGPTRIAPFVIDAIKSKNARQRAECLQILDMYISRGGVGPLKTLDIHKVLASQLPDRDQSVRSAAINALVSCYREEGDKMWRSVGKIADKERSYVEERIKRTGAALGVPGEAPVASTPLRRSNSVNRAGGSTVTRRRDSSVSRLGDRGRSMIRPEVEDPVDSRLNGTFSCDPQSPSREEVEVTQPVAKPSRYAIDEEFVDVGISSLASTQLLLNVDLNLANDRPEVAPLLLHTSRPTSAASLCSASGTVPEPADPFEMALHHMKSDDLHTVKRGFEEISHVFSIEEDSQLSEQRISLVMEAVARQIDNIRRHMAGGNNQADGTELMHLTFGYMNALLNPGRVSDASSSTVSQQQLNLDEDAMEKSMDAIVRLLCEKDLWNEQNAALRKAFNKVIIRLSSRVDVTVFFAASMRCIAKSLLADETATAVLNMFSKCIFKWQDIMQKNPKTIRVDVFATEANTFYDRIFDLAQSHPDSMYSSAKEAVDGCLTTAVITMGDTIVSAAHALSRPHPHLTMLLDQIIAQFKLESNWRPCLPDAVAPSLPPRWKKCAGGANGATPTPLSQLQQLVEELAKGGIREYKVHAAALEDYLTLHPEEQKAFEDYVEAHDHLYLVTELLDTYRASLEFGDDFEIMNEGPLADLYDTTAELMRLHAAMRPAANPAGEMAPIGVAGANVVLQQVDLNRTVEAMSDTLTLPRHLDTSQAQVAPPKKTKRRSMSRSAFDEIQGRLAGI